MSYDSDLFYRILEVGERSPILRIGMNNNPTHSGDQTTPFTHLACFYFRTVEYDYPLRIEVYTGNHDPVRITEKVSAMLLPMASDNEQFALPTVLIDADSQSRLIERDLDFLFTQLSNRIGYPHSLIKLRRERMPFHSK